MKRNKIVLVVAAVFSVFSSFSLLSCQSKKQAPQKEITLGINDWPGSYWWLAVKDLGYFEKENVKVNVQLFSNYSDGLNAAISGKIDMFVPGLADIIPAYAQGANIKVVMVQDYSAGADGLIAAKSITTVKDLKGKRIAVEFGGTDHWFLLKCLQNAGISPSDVQLVNMSTGDAANAFIAGQVDAAAIWEPSLSMAQKSTGGNILKTTADKEFEGLIPAVLIVNTDLLKNDRADVKGVMKAWFDARDAYENNLDQFSAAVAKHTEVTADEFKTLMNGCAVRTIAENEQAFTNSDSFISLNTCAQALGGFLVENKLIDKAPESYDALFDDSVFYEVVSELK